jgi:integrase
MSKLTAMKVQKLTAPGKYPDGSGLYLQVSDTGTKSWLFRYQRDKRERWMGLGPVDVRTLKEAREKVRECKLSLLDGVDPIDQRKAVRTSARIAAAGAMTFYQCAEAYIHSHEAVWKNEKHTAQWYMTLLGRTPEGAPTKGSYCALLHSLPVAAIGTEHVLKVLQPIWHKKTDTASKLRGRIQSVLDWATVSNYRTGDNPARWRGHLDKALPARSKVQKVKHHAALPYVELPAFMGELRQRQGVSALALEFTILTAARTGESSGAKRGEFDLEAGTWAVPGERMKGGRDHRVPLSDAALAVVRRAMELSATDYLFPGASGRKPISNMAMLELLRGMRAGVTVHGFRSTFKDWAGERTNFANEVSEAALAHVKGDKVEAAYARGDFFEKRRRLMDAWAGYCSEPVGAANNVVAIHA